MSDNSDISVGAVLVRLVELLTKIAQPDEAATEPKPPDPVWSLHARLDAIEAAVTRLAASVQLGLLTKKPGVVPVAVEKPPDQSRMLARLDAAERAAKAAEHAANAVLAFLKATPAIIATPTEIPGPDDSNNMRRDAPKSLIRRQLEVCARELGPSYLPEHLLSLSLHGLKGMLQGGDAVPYVEADELDRLYVLVRMVQFEIDSDDKEVEEVRKKSRERDLDALIHMAGGQAEGNRS